MNRTWLLDSLTEEVSPSQFPPQLDPSIGPEEVEVSEHAFPVYLRAWVSVATGIIFFAGVSGNVLVPILIWKNRQLRHSTNIFLLNLAVADVLVLVICLPTALVELHTTPNMWIMGPLLCQLVPFVEICVSRASVLTLTVISVERYIAICKPLRSASFCTRHRALALCLVIWPIALLAAGPVLAATEYEEVLHANGYQETACVTSLQKSWIAGYYLGSVGVFFLLPLLFLATVYFLIARRLLSQRARSRKKVDNSHWRARKQVAAMLRAVVVIFFVCLLPFQLFTVWIILSPPEHINSIGPHMYFNLLFACRVLIYANSAANPIIYNVMSAKFRAAFLRLLGLPSKPSSGALRRQSTLTSSSFLSSSSLRRRASFALQRSFSEFSFKRPRSSSFTSVLRSPSSLRAKYLNAKDKTASFKTGRDLSSVSKLRVGAYFSSGSHSNCSSITDVNLQLTPMATPRSLRQANRRLRDPTGFFQGHNSSLPCSPTQSPVIPKRVSFNKDASSRGSKRPLSPLISKEPLPMARHPQATSGIRTQPKSPTQNQVLNSESDNSEEEEEARVRQSLNKPTKRTIVFQQDPQRDEVKEFLETSKEAEASHENKKSFYFTKLKAITYSYIHLFLI